MLKRIALALALSLPLAACTSNPFNVISALTADHKNPVTPAMLDTAQKTMTVAVNALNIYGNLCVNKRLEQTCWGVIESIQVYTRQLPPLLTSARKFVRANDQVNARIVYDAVQELLSNIRRESLAKGVI